MDMIHLNLENLREITGGDKEIELELFEEYKTSSENLLDILQGCIHGDNEKWRETAHALKGISVLLGAEYLGSLAKTAQEQNDAASDQKQKMYDGMIEAHAIVLQKIAAETN